MTDIVERLRREHALHTLLCPDGGTYLAGDAADYIDDLRCKVLRLTHERDEAHGEIERLREALERVSTSNNLPFIWEISRKALEPEP